ncbi:[NU+] prion formation protein 1 [Brettanomyces nanus]|uniref:[NU+] prion formation protein 1 n=1 Tax=Eeniella nana TaxID=13502 RepID=A0A875S503_EENNA|nr:[NU+] prion formation protein 1 [Brettanomyces nanus]QPG75132.1 [NU+] prion formation protein 1 [Brettanomyces nanus]
MKKHIRKGCEMSKFDFNSKTFTPGQTGKRQPRATGNNYNGLRSNKAKSYEEYLTSRAQPTRQRSRVDLSSISGSEQSSGYNTPTSRSMSDTPSVSSINSALSKLEITPISDELEVLNRVQKISEAREQCNKITDVIVNSGVDCIAEWNLLKTLKALNKSKNSALVRESSMILLQTLVRRFAGQMPKEAYFAPLFEAAFDVFADKERTVKRSAQVAIDALYGMFPAEAKSSIVIGEFLTYMKTGAKWQSKVAALKQFEKLVAECPADLIEMIFYKAIPVLTDMATDFKPELAAEGIKTLKSFLKVLDNLDLCPRYDLIAETLADPHKVPECIKALSAVTFVAEVTEPALSMVIPILDKSLKMATSSQEQLRQTVKITENLTRLINNRREIARFIPILLPDIKHVVDTAALPEVRYMASEALKVLEAADAEERDGKFHGRLDAHYTAKYLSVIEKKIADGTMFDYLVTITMADANVWDWKSLAEYFEMAFPSYYDDDEEEAKQVADNIVGQLKALMTPNAVKEPDDGETVIVNTDFSLAYGARMLLNKTNIRLAQGHRYGLCGRNGVGKSTLLRAIANGQLEGFPDKNELRTCFVEHKLQYASGESNLVDFIKKDPELQDATSAEVAKTLEEVGFDDEKRKQSIGALSGGWKMKLELARGMLMKADVLLLDEPTNHLDQQNVRWLEEYLLRHVNITSLIVSHDTDFLDTICTDIIHYENKKLVFYKGNLSDFVAIKPEAKAYYTLTDSNVKMHFPKPGILTGVKSNTRAVAKMSKVTYTYPGGDKPSLADVSCSISMSSRVAVLGPNGAGKSTLIKLLTGELVPEEGTVEKHPNLRIGYIAQNAFHHVSQHKEKTPNQYLQWRYRFGDDNEVVMKESRKITDNAEKEMFEGTIDVADGRGARQIEALVGRQKYKRSFQYEVKWLNWLPKCNSWVPRDVLIEHGFEPLVLKFDDHEASREGLGYRDLTPSAIREHFAEIGLDSEIVDHTPIGSLSGGQLVKVVIAGAMWNNPHVLVLDEPTNYLDRDSLGALAVAIREWSGAVAMISHNAEFVGALCPEHWIVENGELITKTVADIDPSKFEDNGGEQALESFEAAKQAALAKDDSSPADIKIKKKKKRKLTRNEKKLQVERRRLRYITWLNSPKGTIKPVDSDEE